MNIKLSVLDQTPIRRGTTASQALQESIALAKHTDKLGYTRYWLSEHHNITSLAGAAPEVLIARLAGETQHLRFGSGGIMLPNHSTLKVAENFRLLEALYPGRIDLGVGRAPGGDRVTAAMLNPGNTFSPQDYIQQIVDLEAFLNDTPAPGNMHGKVRAIPRVETAPALWMLTSSGESAYIAAHYGLALSYAQFINPLGGPEALNAYRENFRPSVALHEPQTSVGIFAFAGDTDEQANRVQAVMDYRMLSIEKGRIDESPSYESVKDYVYTPEEWARVQYNRGRMAIGTADYVKDRLTQLARKFDTNEIVIATFADDFAERLRSYTLLADAFNITATAAASVTTEK